MTDVNHRRKNKPPVDRRHDTDTYSNGYARQKGKNSQQRVGQTGFLDKSLHGWSNTSLLSDRIIGAGIGNDFSNGHRGMAKAVAGAKKYVRTRTRFHENAETRKLMVADPASEDMT